MSVDKPDRKGIISWLPRGSDEDLEHGIEGEC